MKCRYTRTAEAEFEASVDYLIEHAPRVAARFADSAETAIQQILEYPYSAQQTEKAGVHRKYVRAFRTSIFYAVDEKSDELVILNIRHAALAVGGVMPTPNQANRSLIVKVFTAKQAASSRLSSAVEQWFCKPKVGGSIPSAGTI